jgi:hypothetical protein
MFRDFNFAVLDSPDFKEDSVREEIVQPILKELGYSSSGENKIIRSKILPHPFVNIGSRRERISIIPDYLLQVRGKNAWVLDAKAPNERVDSGSNVEQAYSYAIHPEIRVRLYALCNGKEFVVFSTEQHNEPILNLKVAKLPYCQEKLYWQLSPQSFGKREVQDKEQNDRELEAMVPRSDSDYIVEKEIGVLWSNLVNEPVHIEIVRFRGQLLITANKEDINGPTSYELYRLPDGRFVVYIQYNHRFDYGGANLVGVNAWGESDPPLTLKQLQEQFPTLATKAGLMRIREFNMDDSFAL